MTARRIPAPAQNLESKPFWDAAKEGRFLIKRCNACGEVYTAEAPEGVGPERYDETAAAMIAQLKYGSGTPFYRLAHLERQLGIPLPAATQWEVVAEVAELILVHGLQHIELHPLQIARRLRVGDIVDGGPGGGNATLGNVNCGHCVGLVQT